MKIEITDDEVELMKRIDDYTAKACNEHKYCFTCPFAKKGLCQIIGISGLTTKMISAKIWQDTISNRFGKRNK